MKPAHPACCDRLEAARRIRTARKATTDRWEQQEWRERFALARQEVYWTLRELRATPGSVMARIMEARAAYAAGRSPA
jgi:hypothetical protein